MGSIPARASNLGPAEGFAPNGSVLETLAGLINLGIRFYWIPGNHVDEALFLVMTSCIPEPEAGAEPFGVSAS